MSLFFSHWVWAESIEVDLGNLDNFNAAESTGLWNAVEGRIQAGVASGGSSAKPISFGDGSDGDFNNGPAQDGITINSNLIIIDTTVKAFYNWRSFNLNSSNKIVVVGPNTLQIRVLGETEIAGQIVLDGERGEHNNESSAAGSGQVSGGNGGRGGTPGGASGVDGLASGSPTRGGSGGTNSATAATNRGGGGGCIGQGPDTGEDATGGFDGSVNLGNQGNCTGEGNRDSIASDFETKLSGGAGGGGGGAFALGGDEVFGAGGGGGGGALRFASLGSITLTGSISAQGGDGGDNLNIVGLVNCGGGGGGGSGGSIWLQTFGSISNALGTVDVSAGTGGNPTEALCTYQGGRGSRGIFELIQQLGATSPSGTVTPFGGPDFTSIVQYTTGDSYIVYSNAIDLSDKILDFTGTSETLGCGSSTSGLTVTYQGSDDGVNWGAEKTASELSELSDLGFIRFIVRITSSGTTTPCLTGLKLNYSPRELSDITLKGGLFCGSISGGNGGSSGPDDMVFLASVLLGFYILLRRRKSLTNSP